jgi:transposase
VREVLNGIFYVLWTGCQWKALRKDLPPKSTASPVEWRRPASFVSNARECSAGPSISK